MIGKYGIVIVGLFILLVNIIGCSAAKEKTANKKTTLSNKYYHSGTTDLLIKIPSGWNEIKDNKDKLFDFWLVSPDKNSAIVFVPHTFNGNNFPNDRIALEFLSKTVKKLKQNTNKDFHLLNNIETYKQNKLWFNGFRFKINNNEGKSILFGYNNKFYECIAYFNEKYNPTKAELDYLFRIQNLVLSTVQIK